MVTDCTHPDRNKRPRERGLFVPVVAKTLSRRQCCQFGLGGLLGSVLPLARANSFDEFFRAIAADSPRTLQTLANRGFDLNTRNEKSDPPLVLALRHDALKVVAFLLSRPEVDVEARTPQDESPLMLAALKGRLAQCEALIQRNAHVNKPGWTPLHYAASHPGEQAPAVVQLLLDHHAYIDAASPNGSTPLMLAAMYGNAKVVAQLLDAGADASLKNEQGMTALDFAHRAGRPTEAERIARSVRGNAPIGQW